MNLQPIPQSPARRTLVFLGLLTLLVFAADRGMGAWLRHLQNLDRAGQRAGGRLQRVLSGQVQPFLLVLGNSRATHGVDPGQFPCPTFNLGHDGRHIYFIEGVLGLLEEQKRLPPAVLIHLSREDFVAGGSDEGTLSDQRFLRIFRRPGNWVDRASASWPFTDRLKFISALYPFNGQIPYLLQDFFAMRLHHEPPDGFEPLARKPGDSVIVEETFNRNIPVSLIPIRVSPEHVAMLADLLALAKRHQVRVALFTSPEYRDDTAYYAPVYQSLDSLLKADGIPYLDFNRGGRWPLREVRWFKNSDHLNVDGAQRLSQALIRWLQPWLASCPGNNSP